MSQELSVTVRFLVKTVGKITIFIIKGIINRGGQPGVAENEVYIYIYKPRFTARELLIVLDFCVSSVDGSVNLGICSFIGVFNSRRRHR